MKSIFEQMGGTYTKVGDYYIPNLALPTEKTYSITAYPCGAVSYNVDKKRLSIRFTSPYSEERRAKARNYAIKNNIISNIDSRHKESI